ncbi:VWA domain-containing protein [Brucepastera parasyntrophica]|uniref:vWA domain-containing protein n=1 Tax=Brucepastera parasyntrophica TaxID=2880008 RepID=UPI00210A3270|nr:vWA domain-containing protein [Brucepastera parasyntrophica]ULQ59893.1 VWA domain-containing protein [Brucepastera parasyntrophica]
MLKIKKIFALIIMCSALFSAFAAGADIVVLMDTSGTMLPWYNQINSQVLPDITRRFVRQTDTFHLISFNSRVNLEIVQPIQNEVDISRIVSRFMLLFPLGQNSDFLSGLNYTWQYISSLNQQRQKIVIIISDGIFNPPSSSRYANYTPEQVHEEIVSTARRIRGAGWNVYYIKLPFPDDAEVLSLNGTVVSEKKEPAAVSDGSPAGTDAGASAQQTGSTSSSATAPAEGQSGTAAATEDEVKQYYDVSGEFTNALDIPASPMPQDEETVVDFVDTVFSIPRITYPENMGKKGQYFTIPFKVQNISRESLNLELTGVYWGSTNILEKTAFLKISPNKRATLRADIKLPDSVQTGPQEISFRLEFSDNLRVEPRQETYRLP